MGILQKFKDADRKKQLLYSIVILVILLLLIFGGVWLASLLQQEGTEQAPTDQPGQQQQQQQRQEEDDPVMNPISVQQEMQVQEQEVNLRIIAEPFVERYGSYNNQNNLRNFTEVEEFMTSELQRFVFSTYSDQLEEEMPSIDTYYAINTRVISSDIEEVDEEEGTATITMQTQREEIGESGQQTNVFYQDVTVSLERVNSEWLVSGVFWN